MDDGFSVRAKRLRDTCFADGEVENAHRKFSRLLETSRPSHNDSSHPSLKELKLAALELIDDYQNFDGILRESEDGLLQQGNCSLEQLSLLAEDKCVAVIKSQASKAACPLDLLAPEILGKKLLQLLTVSPEAFEEGQLLKASQLAPVNCILKVIKHLLAEQSFNRVCFTKHLTNKGHCLPLEVIWLLHANCIVSFSTYLACCLQQQETVKIFADALTILCSHFIDKEKQENILSVVLGCLVRISSLEKRTNKLEKVSQEILDTVVERNDFQAKGQTSDNSEEVIAKTRFCVLEIIRMMNDLPQPVLRKFFLRQLNRLLAAQGEVETTGTTLYQAVTDQKMWKFSSLPQATRTASEQFLIIFDPPAVLESLKQAVFKEKVNWQNTLSFLSVFVVLVKEAASLIHGYVNNLVNEALNNNDHYSLNVAFLMIRQLSIEGGHVFQPYITWFQSTFGDQGNPKLNNKRTVQFFMKFLSDLVPYEDAEYLKVHILRPPQVLAKLRVFVTDYASLAKTRLLDLKEPVELIGHSTAGTGTHNENTKQLENASTDVEKVLETFEKTGKVPGTVMEASIFRKPYFVGRFIPALLLPRKIPDEPDARVQLIDVLNKAGKIPKKMLLAYQSACEKITSEQMEVSSSSDDEGQLSSLERLGRSLDQATKLIVESFKTVADTSQQKGKVSSQLSIVCANIQAAINTSDDLELTNQLVEFDVGSVVKDETEPVSKIILNAFCKTYNAVKSCSLESNESDKKRHQWAPNFVAIIRSLRSLHKSIYQQVWKKICLEGVSLNMDQIPGLAAFLCHLSVHQNTMTPVLLKGTLLSTAENFHGDFTVCSYLDALCESVSIRTKRWMEFFVRFSCAFVGHAVTAFDGNVTNMKSNVGDHTAYLPQALLKKMFYLFNRLNVNGETNVYKPTLSQDLVGLMNNVTSIPIFKELKEKEDQLSLSQWCRWELNISARDDFLPETARHVYQQFRVLDHFLPSRSLEGGCDGSTRKACSVIFHALLDSESSSTTDPSQGHEMDLSRNDMIILLQELIPMLSASSGTACDWEGKSLDPWLLEQLDSRIEKVRSRVDDHLNDGNNVCNLQTSSEMALFMKLVVRLPPFLLFADQQDALPDMRTIKRVTTFINSDIRLYLSEHCSLPFDITVYILKAGMSFSNKTLHGSRTAGSSQLLSQLLADCPLFSVSLQHYWKQLKPLVPSHCHVQQGPLQQTELFFNWIIRVEKGHSVSIKELEPKDPCLLACCCFAALQRCESGRIMTLFDSRTSPSTEFLSKVVVCLFDCIMSRFSDLILRGHQVTDNAHLRDFALRLAIQFPMTLSVFTSLDDCSDLEEIQRLRSFVLKEQLIRLYPAVFFSFFSNSPREALQEVISMGDFLKITLLMYNAFVSLRKDCLEGVARKSAISSPLHLDFCRQVSNFVRNCVLSSPVEHLQSLSEDVISSCTSELRQFLHSQLKKYPQR